MQQVENHIDEEGCLQLRVVRCALFGAPGVGKTSSMKRLTDQIENLEGMPPLPSTGIERPITVPLFSTTKQLPVLIAESEWSPQDLDSQLQMILQCIITADDGTPLPGLVSPPSPATGQTKFPVPTQPSGLSPSTLSSKAPPTVSPDPQDSVTLTGPVPKTPSLSTPPQPAPSKPPDMHFIRDLLKKKRWKKIRNLIKEFDDVTLLNIVDTGGQPEYQDILPVLLGGSGLSLLFHNLSQDLEQPYPVVYRHEEGRSSVEYHSQLTTLQMLFQVLATITTTSSGEPPAAVLIGTHRDKVARSDLDSMEEVMHKAMEGTDFLKSDMIQTFDVEGKKRIVYPLDNMTGTKAEIKRLQKIISDITKRFKQKPIPTSWLLFHLAMRYLYEEPGFCTMEQCVQLAARCGIKEKEVPHILSYFHNNFGTILHFPSVPCLKDIVICNPSIIFKAINTLVAESFATNPDAPHMAQSIRETGEIPKSLLDRICSSQATDVLPALHIIELLKCHRLISEVCTSEAGQERRQTVLFMPCLLQLCNEMESLEKLHQQKIAPLFIHFSCGYIPMGLFPALIASLSERWILDRTQRYKNKVKFITDPSSLARCQLTMELKHIQVQAQHRGGVEELNQVCITIRQTLLSTITDMGEKFPYLKGITPQLQFLCPVSTDSKQFATCLDKESPRKMLCSAACCSGDNTHDLLPKHRIWFSSFEVSETTHHAALTLC